VTGEGPPDRDGSDGAAEPLVRLPPELRDAFKQPMGDVYTAAAELLAVVDGPDRGPDGDGDGDGDSDPGLGRDHDTDRDRNPDRDPGRADGKPPLIAVGDVVTYHLREAGRSPDVALVDGLTERSAVRPAVREAIDAADARRLRAANPPGGLTRALLAALRAALAGGEPTVIEVDGEEDLAALPAILAAPEGASVVYGQPGEGMVHVPVTAETRARARALFERLGGDTAAAMAAVGVNPDPDPDSDP